mgnify:CR=1 FL=1
MSKPWSYGPKQFTIPAGAASVIQLDVPHRAVLRRLGIRTTVDSITGPFEIYTSENAALAAKASGVTATTSHKSMVVPAASFVMHSGALVGGVYSSALDVPYENADGSPSNCIQRLWLRIVPSGTGNLTFTINMTMQTPSMM